MTYEDVLNVVNVASGNLGSKFGTAPYQVSGTFPVVWYENLRQISYPDATWSRDFGYISGKQTSEKEEKLYPMYTYGNVSYGGIGNTIKAGYNKLLIFSNPTHSTRYILATRFEATNTKTDTGNYAEFGMVMLSESRKH